MIREAVSATATMTIRVLADDPSYAANGLPVLTTVRVPKEPLELGPRGARFEIIDFDSSTGHFYDPASIPIDDNDNVYNSADKLIGDPRFHAQHVYGVAAATLFEFERALGRSLSWGFAGRSHQLKLVPHAFCDANAFYSRADEALLFGYFRTGKRKKTPVFTCLSHDIVAHETTHALLDGLRDQYLRPSSPQQAAFHEAFADIVALFSVLRSESLIQFAMQLTRSGKNGKPIARTAYDRIPVDVALSAIRDKSVLFGLAEQFGSALAPLYRGALRRSVTIEPEPGLPKTLTEEHELGELLVAAMMRAFLDIWAARLTGKFAAATWQSKGGKEEAGAAMAQAGPLFVDAWRMAEEGAKAAQHLLIIAIRAIDYMPPVHIEFSDFLKAIVTADWRVNPDDSAYNYRGQIINAFNAFGIEPQTTRQPIVTGGFAAEDAAQFHYNRGNIDSLHWDRESMFRFLWQNRDKLGLVDDAYTRVSSVRSVWRVSPEGMILRETVAEYYQLVKRATKTDLERYRIPLPDALARDDEAKFDLVGGGTLIFDEFGRLQFHIANHINSRRQTDRLASLAARGQLVRDPNADANSFAMAHLRRRGGDFAPCGRRT